MLNIADDNKSVSEMSAYRQDETYTEVSDLLKGIFKTVKVERPEPAITIQEQAPKYEVEESAPKYLAEEPINTQIVYEEPIHLKVNVPKIDYDSLKMRQNEFERRREEWIMKINEQEGGIGKLKGHNLDLTKSLRMLNFKLDELVQKAQVQQQMQYMRDQSPVVYWEYECNHEPVIDHLEEQIQRKDQAIQNVYDRMHNQVAIKEREIANSDDKLITSKKELASLKKKTVLTENDKMMALQDKIRYTLEQNKELERDLKLLKKQQKTQGKTLVTMDDEYNYPEKIKQLMEEVRVAKERSYEFQDKLTTEEKQIARHQEQIETLESQKDALEYSTSQLGDKGVDPAHSKLSEQDMLIQKIIDLDQEVQAKGQENKLLVMKFKNIATATASPHQKSQINLSHVDGYNTNSRNIQSVAVLKPLTQQEMSEQKRTAGIPSSQKTGRGSRKLDPLDKANTPSLNKKKIGSKTAATIEHPRSISSMSKPLEPLSLPASTKGNAALKGNSKLALKNQKVLGSKLPQVRSQSTARTRPPDSQMNSSAAQARRGANTQRKLPAKAPLKNNLTAKRQPTIEVDQVSKEGGK